MWDLFVKCNKKPTKFLNSIPGQDLNPNPNGRCKNGLISPVAPGSHLSG